jgi:hypothetical protein
MPPPVRSKEIIVANVSVVTRAISPNNVAAQFRKAYPMPGAYLEIGLLVRRRIQPAAEASREVPLF